MALLVLLVCGVPASLASDAVVGNRDRVKAVEDYVLSANFDSADANSPQAPASARRVYPDYGYGYRHGYQPDEKYRDDGDDSLTERDLVLPVHHHHHQPAPPPPPPPPVAVSPYSLFALGFIGFLTLIATLQSSLALMVKQKNGGLLGGLVKPPARRRRTTKTFIPVPEME